MLFRIKGGGIHGDHIDHAAVDDKLNAKQTTSPKLAERIGRFPSPLHSRVWHDTDTLFSFGGRPRQARKQNQVITKRNRSLATPAVFGYTAQRNSGIGKNMTKSSRSLRVGALNLQISLPIHPQLRIERTNVPHSPRYLFTATFPVTR